MKNFVLSVVLFFSVFLFYDAIACTSAIVTGRVTSDGRPLLWKHRDTGQEQNRIEYFAFGKYSFVGLVNSPDEGGAVWVGTNEAGFSIMNTASYNLKDKDDDTKDVDREGELMFKALAVCRTLADFELFLDSLTKPLGVEANFGVIDAEGGAALYEVNNFRYTKIDVNDPAVAPLGYLIITNYSFTGRFNDGMGYIRHQTASELFARMAPMCSITPLWIAQEASRSFYHSLLGIDLRKIDNNPNNNSGWFVDQDFIPRRISSASVIIQGVKPKENPQMTIMWTILGYPPASIMVPLWVKAGERQPALLMRTENSVNAPLCEWVVELKNKTFPIKRGSGNRYFYWREMYNEQGTGYMQRLQPVEEEIYRYFAPKIEKWRVNDNIDVRELNQAYSVISEWITKAYFL